METSVQNAKRSTNKIKSGSLFFEQWELQSMVWPGIIFMIIFNFIPIYGLIIAFKRYTVIDTLETAPWVGFENFQIILNDKFFGDQL